MSVSDTPDPDRPKYWFPAKTYGWGWGPPATWQGWLVLGGFIALVSVASVAFPPGRNTPAFVASIVVLTAAMIVVCLWKGEPPRWRWGSPP